MTPRIATLYLIFLLLGSSLRAQMPELDRSQANVLAVPEFLRVGADGKYPDVHIMLVKSGCHYDGEAKTQFPKGDFRFVLTGAGVYKISSEGHDECTAWFDLKTTSAEYGTTAITIMLGNSSVGTAFLDFIDPLARRTPAAPQVDVMWAPIGTKTCNKAFGRQVAQLFYCIGLKIGNNSGYTLQIAGVGFRGRDESRLAKEITPNSSYALTRAVAQDGFASDARAVTLNSVAGLGLLMAGFSPYFIAEGSVAKYNTAASIVSGPLQKALSLLLPDHTQVRANNLDDQSLRDNKLIPNNTQVTTVVFLDKASVSLDNGAACKKLFRPNAPSYAYSKESDRENKDKAYAQASLDTVKKDIASQSRADGDAFQACLNGKSSSGLKAALGELVLVGDTIKYVQRIVVDDVTRTEAGSPGLGFKTAAVDYDKLTLVVAFPEKLPDVLNVSANGITAQGKRSGNDGNAVRYTLSRALPNMTSFSVRDDKGTVNLPNIGNVSDPPAIITDGPQISGSKLTMKGSRLLQAPDYLAVSVAVAGKPQRLQAKLQDGPKESEAVYILTSSERDTAVAAVTPDSGAEFSIIPQNEFPPKSSLTGLVDKSK